MSPFFSPTHCTTHSIVAFHRLLALETSSTTHRRYNTHLITRPYHHLLLTSTIPSLLSYSASFSPTVLPHNPSRDVPLPVHLKIHILQIDTHGHRSQDFPFHTRKARLECVEELWDGGGRGEGEC